MHIHNPQIDIAHPSFVKSTGVDDEVFLDDFAKDCIDFFYLCEFGDAVAPAFIETRRTGYFVSREVSL